MPTVVADATLPSKLATLTEPAEIVDVDGRKLGRFLPEPAAQEPLCPWDPTLTVEEADRIADEPSGTTLAEFWKQMGRT
jgi:hypothetical protein